MRVAIAAWSMRLRNTPTLSRRLSRSLSSLSPVSLYEAQQHLAATAVDHAVIQPNSDGTVDVSKAANAIRIFGFAIMPRMYTGEALEHLESKFVAFTDQTLEDLDEETRCTGEDLQVGSSNGFHEVCLRSPGRYDVSTQFSAFRQDLLEPIEAIVSNILGSDHARAFCGVVYSAPGSEDQQWHADSLHLESTHKDANLISSLLALHDIDMSMGPTELAPMTHLLTNHMNNPRVNGIDIVYQHPENLNRPELVGALKDANICMALPAGSLILFDDRILHRGRGNKSTKPR